MVNPLLKTKLFIPQTHRDIVKRPRLTEFLNNGLHYPLILLSSQAGSGKSTCLADWVEQLSIPVAWVSLDESDNDHSIFIRYLVAALQKIVPECGKEFLDGLGSGEIFSLEYCMASLINDIIDFGTDFVLILDDFHVIQSMPIQQAVAYLVEHMPHQMHLVISTRLDPRLPITRLRARNQVLELRMDQFRFSEGETEAYLNQSMGLDLSKDESGILQARTEGWIASLQMAALSLKSSSDSKKFITDFSGSNRYIMDYLMEEVINQQSPSIQNFLLQTCILERLNESLCNAVTQASSAVDELNGNNDTQSDPLPTKTPGQEVLEHLERSNLFIIPLDEERKWYRYHHLFSSLLRARLAHMVDFPIHTLHVRASEWYEQNGYPEEAIHHALAARDFPRAARLVEGIAQEVWLKGEYFRLMEWIKALPVELVLNNAWLCVWNAWSLTQTGLLKDAGTWIVVAERALKILISEPDLAIANSQDIYNLQLEITTLQALTAGLTHDYERAIHLASWILDNPPESMSRSYKVSRCQILHGLSSMYFASGELTKAEQACLETIQLSQEIGFTLRYLHAVNKLAYIYQTTGQLHRSYLFLSETLDNLKNQGYSRQLPLDILRCRIIDLLYEWNRLEDAQHLATQNLTQENSTQLPYITVDICNQQARSFLLEGNYASAQKIIDKADALTRQAYIWPGLTWQTESLQVMLWLKTGDTQCAKTWAENKVYVDENPLPFSVESQQISRARILIMLGNLEESNMLLSRLEDSAVAGNRAGSLVKIRCIQAITLHSSGKTPEAVNLLEKTLAQAEPEAFIRSFTDEGPLVAELLSLIIQAGTSPQEVYARQILSAFEQNVLSSQAEISEIMPGSRTKPVKSFLPSSPVEPLTRREQEVLCCMAEGLSNRETARRLSIETSTVKRHINNIFSKLGAENRVQAINIAKTHQLL